MSRRWLFGVSAIFALVATCIAASPVVEPLSSDEIVAKAIVGLDHIVPAGAFVAKNSKYPFSANLAFIVSWLFFPLMFLGLCLLRPPWIAIDRSAGIQRLVNAKMWTRRQGIAHLLVFMVIIFLICCDVGIFEGPSFYRGTLWRYGGPRLLQMPFSSRLGIIVAAYVSSIFSSGCYYAVIFLGFNRYWIEMLTGEDPHIGTNA